MLRAALAGHPRMRDRMNEFFHPTTIRAFVPAFVDGSGPAPQCSGKRRAQPAAKATHAVHEYENE
jgi:hypothetical protein